MSGKNEDGMTLLEVLAALTLFVFILGVMAEFLYNGVHFWGRNDRAYQRQHQLALIDRTLRNDLESAYTNRFLPANAFEGKETEMVIWRETTAGMEQRRYRYDREQQSVFRSSGLWGAKPEESPLFSKIKEWQFEYLNPKTKNWSYDWVPAYKTDIPALVRVTVKTETGDLGKLVFSIRTQPGEVTE